jgi:hypothetical protein
MGIGFVGRGNGKGSTGNGRTGNGGRTWEWVVRGGGGIGRTRNVNGRTRNGRLPLQPE